MKIRFFTLLAILIIVVAALCTYFAVNRNHIAATDDISAQDITLQPTVTPIPSATPVPADYESAQGLYPAFQTEDGAKKYGYINDNGVFTINPSFDSASDFHDTAAIVYMDEQYLVIGTRGNIVYYSDNPIRDFHNDAAVISRYSGDDTLYGYIDTEGKEIIKPLYKMVSDFRADDTAYVYTGNGNYALINRTGKTLESYKSDLKYKPYSIEDGYIIYINPKNNLYGAVDLQGKVILKPKYCDICYLGDNLFAVKKPDDTFFGLTEEIPSALYNAKGEQLTDYTLYDISRFHDGYASVTDSTSTYFIGEDGKKVPTLPKFEGRGTVTLYGDMIKAVIDNSLIYSRTDSTIVWQNDTTQKLSGNIATKSIKFKPNKYALIYYPEIDGLADSAVQEQINAGLKTLFTKDRADLKESDLYGVDDTFSAKIIKNLLIIERDGYDYPFGAAHGSPIMDYYYIDITTGKFYQLKDLFLEGSDYATAINERISSDITAHSKEDSMYFPDAFTGITENQIFMLSEHSLIIYFYPYDIAAYAAGFPQFEIPFDDLYEYIDFKGAFWSSFN